MTLERRQFLAYLAAIGALAACPSLLASTATAADTGLEAQNPDLHLAIAELAKNSKQSDGLKLLLPKGSEHNVQPVAELFMQLTGIKIDVETVPVDDINTRMLLDIRLGTGDWDLALPATFGIPDLVEAGAIADLTTLRQAFEPAQFSDNTFYQLGDFYQERFYGYQSDGDVYMMFYNQLVNDKRMRAQFAEEFGHSYRLPKTWDEFDRHLHFFHAPELDRYGGLLFRTPSYLVWEFWARFHATGQLPLKDDLTPNIDHECGIKALEGMISTMECLHPSVKNNGLVDNWKMYAKGNVYANIGWGGTQKYFVAHRSPVLGHLRYHSLPGGQVGQRSIDSGYFNWGWNYTVSPKSKDQKLAYLFSLFAVSPVPSTHAVAQENGFFDPFREEHYQDKRIRDIYTGEFLQSHKASMQNCIPDFYLFGQHLYFGELQRYLTAAINGDISPEKALKAVALSWQNTHEKMGYEKQRKQWLFLKSQYPNAYLQAVNRDT